MDPQSRADSPLYGQISLSLRRRCVGWSDCPRAPASRVRNPVCDAIRSGAMDMVEDDWRQSAGDRVVRGRLFDPVVPRVGLAAERFGTQLPRRRQRQKSLKNNTNSNEQSLAEPTYCTVQRRWSAVLFRERTIQFRKVGLSILFCVVRQLSDLRFHKSLGLLWGHFCTLWLWHCLQFAVCLLFLCCTWPCLLIVRWMILECCINKLL